MKAGISIETSFFPLAWILHFVTPTIEINGVKHHRKWGMADFELEPGEYSVKISFPYLGNPECGANSVVFTLSEAERKFIRYEMSFWIFDKGAISVR